MTPIETLIATTFPAIPIEASILGDRVVLHIETRLEADYVLQNCDALLPPLELTRSPWIVYLHCSESNTYQEINYRFMLRMAALNTNEKC